MSEEKITIIKIKREWIEDGPESSGYLNHIVGDHDVVPDNTWVEFVPLAEFEKIKEERDNYERIMREISKVIIESTQTVN